MAVTIQTKRSTGTSAPGTLGAGELAVTYGGGTQGNLGERLFIGNNDGSSVLVIGGKYFSDKLDHVDGTLTASSALTADSNSSINTIKIGNHNANAPEFKLMEATANGTSAIILKGQASLDADKTITFPSETGTALTTASVNSVLQNLGTQDENLDMGTSYKIVNLAEPTNAQDAATKNYVDANSQGLDIKESCVVGSTQDIDSDASSGSFTYNNGTAGVGATLTNSHQEAVTMDGVALDTINMRVLLKDQSAQAENGIYRVSTVGTGGAALVLTRTLDGDSPSDLSSGSFTFVEKGTVNADNGFVMTQDAAITIGTTAITWSQFSGAGQITAGNGIEKSGNTINLDIKANSGIVIDGVELSMDLGASSITGTLAVGDGGTGATTLTDGGILLGSGTGAITAMAVLADGEMIVGDGTTDPVAESGDTLRISIGVGSSSTWQITGLNIGHASDTTLTRASAGDLQIESNIIYRAGGTDVAVADGGTGLSAAAKGSVLVANSADTISALDGGGSNDGLLLYASGSDTISWSTSVDGGTF